MRPEFELIRCTTCKVLKTANLFYRTKQKKNGRRSLCKVCCNNATKRWVSANPDAQGRHNRTRRARTYGLSWEQVTKLYEARDGRCDICGRHCLLEASAKKAMSIDHDHETGEVRGMLCPKCNRGLGCMEDNPGRLRAAADYLERKRL